MQGLDPDDGRPPYQQVAAALRRRIEAAELRAGDQLPALQALSDTYGVSVGTVKSALVLLRDAGLIVTRHGKGSFVRTGAPGADQPTDSLDDLDGVRRAVTQLAARLDKVERLLADR